MADKNHDRVKEILYAVRDGLGPYVLYRYKKKYTRKKYLEEIREALDLDFDVPDEETAIEKFDTEKWLNLMIFRWDEVFPNKPDKADYRSHFYGLRSARNKWAHPRGFGPFTDDQVRHVAATAILLLKGTNPKAKEEIETIQDIANDLSSQHSSKSEQKTTEKSTPANNNHRSSTDSRLDVEVLQKIEDKEYQMQTPENKHKQSSDSSSNHRFKPDKQTDEEKVESLERTSHADDTIQQQLLRQHQEMMRQMQQTSQPIININPNISPNINPSISANAGDQVAYAPPALSTVIAERNNAAFVVGVLGGLFGLLGIAHIFNHKAGRGLVYLFVGTVCYWIFLLLLLTALTNIGSSL